MSKSPKISGGRAPPPPKNEEAVECCSKDQSPAAQLHTQSTMSVMTRHPSTTWSSITNMPKDIAVYAIDQAVLTDVKAKDIQLHTNNESADPFVRAMTCLKSDQLSEKVYVADKTGQLIQTDAEKYFKDIFPGLEKELKQEAEELHSAAADSFGGVYKFLMAKYPARASLILQLMFRCIDSKNPNISQIWSTVILDLVNALGPKELEKDFLPEIISRSKSGNPNVRNVVAVMIKHMIVRSVPFEKALAPVISALLEDPVPLVRGTMCQQLGPIYHSLPSKDGLMDHINRIYKDNDPFVKKSLINTIGGIYKYPDMKPLHDLILSILKRTIKEAFVQGNVDVLLEFTSYIGEMAKVMTDAGSLNGDSKLWFLDAFIQLSRIGLTNLPAAADQNLPTGFLNFRANMGYNRRHSLVESLVSSGAPPATANKNSVVENGWKIRANAAREFLNFFKFAKPLVDFKLGLHPLMDDLIHDPHLSVRAAMSNCFWPVMETLGNAGHHLYGEFVYILSDDALDVVEGITPHVSKILKVLAAGKIISPEQHTQALVEIGGALIFCEERLAQSNSWRVHTQFLSQLTVLPFCFPSDYIYSNFVPTLFHRLIHLRHLPARMGVADALVSFLRYSRRAQQREEIRNRIKESFAKGKSVQDRMLFLYMSRKIIDIFSRKYFREHFFDQTLRMADDAVANVRMKVSNMMPEMKGTLNGSEDDRLLIKLDEVAMRLRESETDRDVLNAIDEAMTAMRKIGLRFAGDKTPKTKADAEDEAKEKEETFVASLEPAASAPSVQSTSGKDKGSPTAPPPKDKDKEYFKTTNVSPRKASDALPENTRISIYDLRKNKPLSLNPVAAVEVADDGKFRARAHVAGEIVTPTTGAKQQPKK